MLTGQALGEALEKAIALKGVSKAQLARDFGVRGPSVHDWIANGRIGKRHIDKLIAYFADVVPASHWGISEPFGSAQTQSTSGVARFVTLPEDTARFVGAKPQHIAALQRIYAAVPDEAALTKLAQAVEAMQKSPTARPSPDLDEAIKRAGRKGGTTAEQVREINASVGHAGRKRTRRRAA